MVPPLRWTDATDYQLLVAVRWRAPADGRVPNEATVRVAYGCAVSIAILLVLFVQRADRWLQSSVPESKLISHPAPARPSLAVGLFGVRAGEHARGAVDTAHIPLGPGRRPSPPAFLAKAD